MIHRCSFIVLAAALFGAGAAHAANDWTASDVVLALRQESGATATDSSSNAYTVTNNGVGVDTTYYAEGAASGRYAAGTDYLYIPYASLPTELPGKANDQTFTVTGYFRRDNTDWPTLVAMYDDGADERSWLIYVGNYSGYKLTVEIGHTNGTAGYTITNTISQTEDQMYFFGVIFDAGTVKTYLYNEDTSTDHGWQTDTTTWVNSMSYNEGCDFSVGDYAASSSYGALPLSGQLDEIIVFDRALSQTEVENVHAGTYTAPASGSASSQAVFFSCLSPVVVLTIIGLFSLCRCPDRHL